jgi:hypothetical protein
MAVSTDMTQSVPEGTTVSQAGNPHSQQGSDKFTMGSFHYNALLDLGLAAFQIGCGSNIWAAPVCLASLLLLPFGTIQHLWNHRLVPCTKWWYLLLCSAPRKPSKGPIDPFVHSGFCWSTSPHPPAFEHLGRHITRSSRSEIGKPQTRTKSSSLPVYTNKVLLQHRCTH